MNFDFQKARDLMIVNQLRPNKIKDPVILDLFKNIKKEDFLSKDLKYISYSDLDITVDKNRGYLKNLHIAQLIDKANINKKHKVLHIGGMTGYVSVMLSNICKELIVIENKSNLFLVPTKLTTKLFQTQLLQLLQEKKKGFLANF